MSSAAPCVIRSRLPAAFVIAVVLVATLAGRTAAQSAAFVGMTPPALSAVTLNTIRSSLAGDVASALSVPATSVALREAAAATGLAGSFNATLQFSAASNASAPQLAADLLTLAMVTRSASARYTTYLSKYGMETVVLGTIATTTGVAPAPNATTINGTTVAPPPDMTSTAPAFTPAPTQFNPNGGNNNGTNSPLGDIGGGGDDDNNTIYAVVFGILAAILVVAGITFCIKKFAMREKSDTSRRGGGYKYAARNAQHI